MTRAERAGAVWPFLILVSCGALNEETRPEAPTASETVVVIPRRAGRPQVEVTEEAFRVAMRELLAEVRMPVRFGSRVTGLQVVPVASWEPLEHGQLAMARDYRMWCERRHKPSDCLDLLRSGPVLSESGKYKIAFDIALGAQWEGFAGELNGMADPALVRVVLLGTMVAYMGAIAFPEVITKGIAAAATVVLTAYLGAEAVWNLVFGWIHMVGEVKAATTFAQVHAAGERYGIRVGAQTARVLVMVATCMLAQAGRFLALVMRLPKFAEASAALGADTGGKLVLADLGQVSGVNVSASGVTVVLVPAAKSAQVATGVAMAARGTIAGSPLHCPEQSLPEPRPHKHHIATNKNTESDVRGGPWTPRFKKLFDRAGMSLEDAENVVEVKNHKGPHPEEYHREVWRRLFDATESCRTRQECRTALSAELKEMAKEIVVPGKALNQLVTGCE